MTQQISMAAARELVARAFASSERAARAREAADEARAMARAHENFADEMEADARMLADADDALWAALRAAGIDPTDDRWNG